MTELHRAPLDTPVVVVASNPDGKLVVVADVEVDAVQAQHALDYADVLAELIPEPRRGER